MQSNYILYGHSMFIDPTGAIVAQAGHSEEILFYEIGTCDVCIMAMRFLF